MLQPHAHMLFYRTYSLETNSCYALYTANFDHLLHVQSFEAAELLRAYFEGDGLKIIDEWGEKFRDPIKGSIIGFAFRQVDAEEVFETARKIEECAKNCKETDVLTLLMAELPIPSKTKDIINRIHNNRH